MPWCNQGAGLREETASTAWHYRAEWGGAQSARTTGLQDGGTTDWRNDAGEPSGGATARKTAEGSPEGETPREGANQLHFAEDSFAGHDTDGGADQVAGAAEENTEKLKAETLNTLDAGRWSLDATAPEALMACVARFEVRDKGQDLLLEALGDPVWRDRDFRLDFFGSGPDREILEDLISFYGLRGKVRIVGFESDIRKIWKEHHLLVLPSLSEGTPISLIEAQLCGRASLVTRVDGNPEWVEEGKTGFLAEAPTVHHLRLALERAWENRHRWAEMGEAARAACLAKRDPNPAGTLLSLLKAAAERRARMTDS